MNKKNLSQELLNNGFNLTKYNNFEKVFNGLNINVIIYASLFGKVKMVGTFYKFKKQLKEELHDEVWTKCIKIMDSQNSYLKLGSLGFDYLEADITDKNILNCINAEMISESCNNFSNLIKDLIIEYDL